MDLDHVFSLRRWRDRFRSEDDVRDDQIANGRAPDATVDEVGVPERSRYTGNGQGSGDVASWGRAGWGGG